MVALKPPDEKVRVAPDHRPGRGLPIRIAVWGPVARDRVGGKSWKVIRVFYEPSFE